MLDAALRTIGEALFPARCIGCRRRGTPLCSACRAELPYLPRGLCPRCATPRLGTTCRGCRRLSPSVSAIHAAFVYERAARAAVVSLKFKSARYLADLMGELLVECLAVQPVQADLVVPVPLSKARLRQRGYNQAALLARPVASVVHGTLATSVLTRTDRRSQRTLSATQRLSNLAGAFRCPHDQAVVGQRVLLVDDVITTGATVSTCADTLARAGASRVSVLAFARDL
ncbi:MAG: ComF family protein [Chloroflexi bacterium]|nr:ComF family protein [Chloroflexota bacterium]